MKGTKRVLIYDSTPDFIESVSMAMQIDDEYPIDIAFITKNYSDFAICVKNNKNSLDAILVNAERLPMMPKESDMYDLPLFFYTTNEDYDEIPDFGKYIGAFKLGEEQKFITKATRQINGWDVDIPEKEKEKQTVEEDRTSDTSVSKPDTSSDLQGLENQSSKISEAEYNDLLQKYEEMAAMVQDIQNNRKAKGTSEDLREEPKEKEIDIKQKKQKTKVVSIYSGKGGTGKTTIASQIAVSLANTPMHRGFAKVCLIDFDFELGDVSNIFNLPEYENEPLDEFILTGTRKGIIEEEDILRISFIPEGLKDITNEGSLRIIPAPKDFIESRIIKPETIDEALTALKESDYFDFIVCDTGNNLNQASLAALLGSDDIYVVYTPDFTTIKCNDSVIEALLDINEKFFTGRFKAIINRATKRSGLSADKIEKSLKNNLDIDVIGVISPDEDVTYCNNYRIPISLEKDKNFYSEIQPVIKDIVGEHYVLPDIQKEIKQEIKEEKKKMGGFFKNLFKKKKE